MPSGEARKQSTAIPLAVLLSIVIMGVAAWQLLGEPAKRRTAERAVNAAVAACDRGDKQDLASRTAEAYSTIEDLDGEDLQIYEARLNNQLRLRGCT